MCGNQLLIPFLPRFDTQHAILNNKIPSFGLLQRTFLHIILESRDNGGPGLYHRLHHPAHQGDVERGKEQRSSTIYVIFGKKNWQFHKCICIQGRHDKSAQKEFLSHTLKKKVFL